MNVFVPMSSMVLIFGGIACVFFGGLFQFLGIVITKDGAAIPALQGAFNWLGAVLAAVGTVLMAMGLIRHYFDVKGFFERRGSGGGSGGGMPSRME